MHTFAFAAPCCALMLSFNASGALPQGAEQLSVDSAPGQTAVSAQPVRSSVTTAGSGGSAYQYCPATASSAGTVAFVGYAGSLDLSQQNFAVFVTGAAIHPSAYGMFIFGVNQTQVAFGNGYLCIQPFARMPLQHLTSETLYQSMQSSPEEFAPFQPGSSWNFQFWYRDAAAGGANFNLSRALHVDFAP
jgi:hypothetical protein